MTMATMRKPTFERLREIVYETSGISLGPRKEALVCARVGKRMRTLGFDAYDDYLAHLEADRSEVVGLLDAVSTNVTSFFREPHHFDFIAEAAGLWYADGQRRFRIWSAACSTGEEPFSLAMVLREALPTSDVDVRILATDISTDALSVCTEAVYPLRRMTPVPAGLRDRWFTQVRGSNGELWRAREQLRRTITFRRMNLSMPPFPMKGPLDAIFCRNVMIYFDDRVRLRLLEECHRLLKPGGLLVVGHAESLAGLIGDFKYVRPSIYRKG